MSNPIMKTLTIDGVTYDIKDNISGYTSNTGTVTGISMNGNTLSPSSGIVTLGTVITAIPEAHSLSYTYAGTGTDPGISNIGDMIDSHDDMIMSLAKTISPASTFGYFLRDDNSWVMPTQLNDKYPREYRLLMQSDGNLVLYNGDDTAIWQTGPEGQRRSPILSVKTVTGTTNTNGNLSLALNPATYDVLSVVRTDDDNTACVPFQGGTNWYARCYTANASTHSVRRNTASTLRVTYFNNSQLF